MPARDLDLLIDAVKTAGDVARGFTGKDTQCWDKPDGAGPVTEADLAVNALLLDKLRSARPDYGWLSEETEDDTARLDSERVFIVDPIDGTRSFIEGDDNWAHSIAIAERGKIIAAAVYLPMRERLFDAALGRGARLNGERIEAGRTSQIGQSSLLASKFAMDPKLWRNGEAPAFRRSYRPSLAYRLSLVGQARFDGMLVLRKSWEWDIAAGSLIVQEAGGQISDRNGETLGFNQADPRFNGVVAAAQPLHSTLIDALAPA